MQFMNIDDQKRPLFVLQTLVLVIFSLG